jgi:hypothetical protein
MSMRWIRILCICLSLAIAIVWTGTSCAAFDRTGGKGCVGARHHPHRACGRPPSKHPPYAAPILRVSGATLSWTRIHGFKSYRLAWARAGTTSKSRSFRLVNGTHFRPRPEPGQTIAYRLKVNLSHSAWSRPVVITWPPARTTAVFSHKLRVAVNNAFGAEADSMFRQIGVSWERLDLGTGSGLPNVRAAVHHGMRVLPVFTAGAGGSLQGLTPSEVASDITSLVPQLTGMGVTTLEFGNEVYRFMNARTYAALYDAAHRAAAGRLVLLAPATTDYYEHARGGQRDWFSDLAAALPGGPAEVDALTLHPYGSMTTTCGDGYGWPMMSGLHAESTRAGFGSSLPWYITEIGQEVSGDPLECQPPVSESVQAADVTRYLTDAVAKYPWVVFLSFYTSRDAGSGFGLLNLDNSARPAFLALKAWMAAHAALVDG